VGAIDPDGDSLGFAFDYGDGTITTSTQHVYATGGVYTVTATVADEFGATDTMTDIITILDFDAVTVTKKKFSRNFKKAFADTLDVTFHDLGHFDYPDKFSLANATDGDSVGIFIGNTLIDTVTLFNGKGKGSFGKVTWKYKTGDIVISVKKSDLTALGLYGAVNETSFGSITVPVSFRISGYRFGAYCDFFYLSVAGKNGKGK